MIALSPSLTRRNDSSREACVYRLKLARLASGLSKSQLAERAGISIQTYSNQESGLVFPSRKVSETLYRDFRIDWNFMFNGDYAQLPGDVQQSLAVAATTIAED